MNQTERAAHILNAMDQLLASAAEKARVPQHWVIQQADWLAIGEMFRANQAPDPDAIGANTYKDIPVHLGTVTENQLVALVDRDGGFVDG